MVSIFDHDDIVDFLKAVYGEKKKKNFTFSLRSYGRDLDISASHLLRVLHGKKHLSLEKAMGVAKKLNLSPTETNYLILLVQKDAAKDEKTKEVILIALSNKKRENMRVHLDAESLDDFTEWFYFGLITLMRTPGFKSNNAWIAKRLGISARQLNQAVAKIRKRKLIEISQNEEIILPHSVKLLIEGLHAKRVLMQTLQHLESPGSELLGLTMAVNPKDLPRAKQLIQEFTQSFNEELDCLDGTEVFQLNLQFYPLTQKES